jgi:DNA-binding transcriptional MerR regulator
VQFALAAGFSLRDTKRLVSGFSRETSAGARWDDLASLKIKDLDAAIARATAMKALLQKVRANCRCESLVDCGRRLAANRARWRLT